MAKPAMNKKGLALRRQGLQQRSDALVLGAQPALSALSHRNPKRKRGRHFLRICPSLTLRVTGGVARRAAFYEPARLLFYLSLDFGSFLVVASFESLFFFSDLLSLAFLSASAPFL